MTAKAECEEVPLGSGQNIESHDLLSTNGSQIEADLEEAVSILKEAIDPHLVPWRPSWRGRAKDFVARLNSLC